MTGPPPLSSDLDALLRRVARGDRAAFAALYDLTKTRDVYFEVWRTASEYDSAKGSPLAWLLTMAHRRAVDWVRSEEAGSRRESRYAVANIDPASAPTHDPVAESAMASDERRRVLACLDALTDAQRQCIELAYYDGLTYVEVSQRLAANLSTIKSRMRDALRGLRNCLAAP